MSVKIFRVWGRAAWWAGAVVGSVVLWTGALAAQDGGESSSRRPVPAALTTAARQLVPTDPARVWLVPGPDVAVSKLLKDFAAGVRLADDGKYHEALPLVSAPGLSTTPLAAYSTYYTALAYLNLSRTAEARTLLTRLRESRPSGYLSELAMAREAEAALAQDDPQAAIQLYTELTGRRTANPDAMQLALAKAHQANGDRQRAAEAFARLYYEFPFSDLAVAAATGLDELRDLRPARDSEARFDLDLGRAERLFGAKRYAAARTAFEALQSLADGDEAEIVGLRLAECEMYLRHYQQARDALSRYLDRASRKAEARFFYLTSIRELGRRDEYVERTRALVADFPQSSWAEEALNNLGTHYILTDDDDAADATFREMYAKFPQGAHTERAAWKAGWSAYRHRRFDQTIFYFEGASSSFPRSDLRPAFLYWSARAREQAGDKAGALAVYKIVAGDYLNSYYGRLAVKRLEAVDVRLTSYAAGGSRREPADTKASIPTSDLIRLLLTLDLLDQARGELGFAQRTWGDSALVHATLAWVFNRQGDLLHGIQSMKRAYPQYMMEEGGRLPVEVLRVIFPMDYWTIIKRHAPANDLDPYLVAALINQESAFDAAAKSGANAIGLMQLLPSTGRQYARLLQVRGYSTAALTRPEINVQLGTAHFSSLVKRYGAVHYALASYNAGEGRVVAWTADRQGLDVDEFIDDIPFPETQGYVKRILGIAEDYRRLYANEADAAAATIHRAQPSAAKPAIKTPVATTPTPQPKASNSSPHRVMPTKAKTPVRKRTGKSRVGG